MNASNVSETFVDLAEMDRVNGKERMEKGRHGR